MALLAVLRRLRHALAVDHWPWRLLGGVVGVQMLWTGCNLLALLLPQHGSMLQLLGVMFSGSAMILALHAIARRLLATIEQRQIPHPASPLGVVTVSIGIAICPATAYAAINLLQQADAALYRAKRNGRNCCAHAQDAAAALQSVAAPGRACAANAARAACAPVSVHKKRQLRRAGLAWRGAAKRRGVTPPRRPCTPPPGCTRTSRACRRRRCPPAPPAASTWPA